MSSGPARKRALSLLAAALPALLVLASFGQSPESPLYRRVFVPEESLNNHIAGLLPLRKDEFERRIALAAEHADSSAGKPAARIEQAIFRARLDGGQLVKGKAELAIISASNEPALLSLEPCGLALESAAWHAKDRGPLVIGRNLAGQLQCLVERSGTLHLEWNLAAAEVASGVNRFDLRLPIAPRRRLEITTPSDIELTVEGGLVLDHQVRLTGSAERIWPIELTGASEIRLYARSASARQSSDRPTIVREETQYSVLPAVVDLETSFTLDVLREPLHELKLNFNRGLQVTAVRISDQSLPFAVVAAENDAEHAITVTLPTELSGTDRVVQIEATARWSGERAIKLPRIQVAGGVLQEGRLEIHSPTWMRLQAQPLGGCVQIDAAAATATRVTDRFVFQAFAADAAIEVAPNQTLAPLREESGTQLNVESTQVTGVLVAELRATGSGARFDVTAELPHLWIVDAVETQPADMLADRTLISRGQNPHRLQVKLARPLTAQQPLRLVIRGHFRRPPNDQPLGDEFFQIARFPDVGDRRQLVAVRVNDPSAELRLSGNEGAPRLDSASLTPSELRLFETPPGSVLLETGSLGQSLHASLRSTTARFRADAMIRAQVAHGRIEETVTIHCQPETSNVSSIVVRVAPRPRGEVTWRLAGDEREIPTLVEDSPVTDVGTEDAVYRLLLSRPYNSPFDVVGQWSSHQSARNELSLVFVPSAIRQNGLIEITAPEGDIFVRTQGLQAIPDSRSDERSAPLYGRFRYEAGRRSKLSVEPLPSGVVQQRAYIESLQLTSHCLPDGSADHEAELKIQNAGSTELQMRLPATASECRLVTEAEAEEPLDEVAGDNRVQIPLPSGRRSVMIRVRYSSKDSMLGTWPIGSIRAPVPHFDLPVLAQTWRVILSPELAAVTPSPESPHSASREADPRDPLAAAAPSVRDRVNAILSTLRGPALVTQFVSMQRPFGSTRNPSFAGWSENVLPLPASEEATLMVYRPGVITAWSYCLTLVAGALVYWSRARSGCLLIAALLAAIAVISPAPAAWLLGGASVGIFLGQLLLLARPTAISNAVLPPYQASTMTKHQAMEPAAGIVAFLIISCAARLFAAPPEENSQARRDRPHVVIPVDNNQQSTGEYVFVEAALYEKLHRLEADRSSRLPTVLFERAHYEFPVAATTRAGGAAVDELTATFDFHTFDSDATVQLPLRRDQMHLLEGRAKLDGQPITLSRESDGRTLSFSVARSGKHRLALSFAAVAQQSADAITLLLDVPNAAISEAMLPEMGNAVGTIVSNGAGGKLHVRWPVADATISSATALEADQLLWWKVRPGSVSLEGRFRLRPLGGTVRDVIFEVDPRLRLLPGRTSGPISAVKVEDGAVDLLKAELAEPASTPVELRLAWLWPDASGMGNLLLPQVKLMTDRLSHDWTAISTDPSLELSRVPPPNSVSPSTAVTPSEFAQVWPDVNLGDSQILAPSPKNESRAIFVRPAVLVPRAEQRTDWSVASTLAQATYTAQLTGLSPSRYEHRLAVPAHVNVSRVNLVQAGRPAAVRWKQADGLLIVSLLEPPAAEQTMTVIADYTLPKNRANVPFPAFVLENVTDGDSTLRIYRQRDVRLKLEGSEGWLPIDQGQIDEYRSGLGRLIAAFRRQSAVSAPPMASLAINQPQISGKIFTRASEDDGDWRGEVQLKIVISGGLLDELRLSVPDEWSEQLEVEPPMEQRLEASQSEGRRQLVLRGRRALSGQVEITLRGTIHAGTGGLQAPDVFLVGNQPLERFVLLDRGSGAEQIDWEMTGLLAIGPSAVTELPPAWSGAGGDWFRVVGQRFDAIAKVRPARAVAPRVALADLRCTPTAGRRVVVTVEMTIQPLGAREAQFMLPAGNRLIQALVDHHPVPCVSQGLRTWSIRDLSETLPYSLTIIYDTYLPSPTAGKGPLRLAAPVLVGMEVQKSLWTIEYERPAPNFAAGYELQFAISDRAPTSSRATAELVRLDAVAHALDTIASAQAAELPRRILADSFLRWNRQLTAIQHRLHELQDRNELPPEMAAQMQPTLDVVTRAEQRLLQAGILSESEIGETMQRQQTASADTATYYLASGNPPELNISWPASPRELIASRHVIAAGIVTPGVLLALVLQLAAVRHFLSANPHWALALLGVAWWLLAPFGWLGLFAISAAIAVALHTRWARSSFEPGSSIVRFSGSQSR